eukprot:7229576-Karenia_brevis.AAC.1
MACCKLMLQLMRLASSCCDEAKCISMASIEARTQASCMVGSGEVNTSGKVLRIEVFSWEPDAESVFQLLRIESLKTRT